MPRILAAEFAFILAADSAPQLAVRHKTGKTLVYDKAALAALLTGPQMNGLRAVLVAVHADADAKVKLALEAERASLELDP